MWKQRFRPRGPARWVQMCAGQMVQCRPPGPDFVCGCKCVQATWSSFCVWVQMCAGHVVHCRPPGPVFVCVGTNVCRPRGPARWVQMCVVDVVGIRYNNCFKGWILWTIAHLVLPTNSPYVLHCCTAIVAFLVESLHELP